MAGLYYYWTRTEYSSGGHTVISEEIFRSKNEAAAAKKAVEVLFEHARSNEGHEYLKRLAVSTDEIIVRIKRITSCQAKGKKEPSTGR